MNERRTNPDQLRVVFQELYRVDPNERRRPIPRRRDDIEDTIPDGEVPV